ncbi:hypothetical protein [Paenibacillus ehimensis]|nr:hypothetical protein [Paenibacillus ehimensis]
MRFYLKAADLLRAAALACAIDAPARELDVKLLQERLLRGNAVL